MTEVNTSGTIGIIGISVNAIVCVTTEVRVSRKKCLDKLLYAIKNNGRFNNEFMIPAISNLISRCSVSTSIVRISWAIPTTPPLNRFSGTINIFTAKANSTEPTTT